MLIILVIWLVKRWLARRYPNTTGGQVVLWLLAAFLVYGTKLLVVLLVALALTVALGRGGELLNLVQ